MKKAVMGLLLLVSCAASRTPVDEAGALCVADGGGRPGTVSGVQSVPEAIACARLLRARDVEVRIELIPRTLLPDRARVHVTRWVPWRPCEFVAGRDAVGSGPQQLDEQLQAFARALPELEAMRAVPELNAVERARVALLENSYWICRWEPDHFCGTGNPPLGRLADPIRDVDARLRLPAALHELYLAVAELRESGEPSRRPPTLAALRWRLRDAEQALAGLTPLRRLRDGHRVLDRALGGRTEAIEEAVHFAEEAAGDAENRVSAAWDELDSIRLTISYMARRQPIE